MEISSKILKVHINFINIIDIITTLESNLDKLQGSENTNLKRQSKQFNVSPKESDNKFTSIKDDYKEKFVKDVYLTEPKNHNQETPNGCAKKFSGLSYKPVVKKFFNSDDKDDEELDTFKKSKKSHTKAISLAEEDFGMSFKRLKITRRSSSISDSDGSSSAAKEELKTNSENLCFYKTDNLVNLVSFSIIETERDIKSDSSLPELKDSSQSLNSKSKEASKEFSEENISKKKKNYDIDQGITSIILKKKENSEAKETITNNNSDNNESDDNLKNFTNTQDILNFYDYTKDCYTRICAMELIPQIENKYLLEYKLDKTKCKK